MELIKPKEIECKSIDGDKYKFTISRIPATYAREIITQYPITGAPKIGNYEANEKLMIKLMSYVEVIGPKGGAIRLTSRTLIDNHVVDFDVLGRIEYEMLKYNSNFFNIGKISKGLKGFESNITQLVTRILTPLPAQSSQKGKQR